MLPSTERYGGLASTSLSPCFFCEDGRCDPPVEAGASQPSYGEFGILALRSQIRRVADKVEPMRKCVVAVHDALDVEEDEPFGSSRPHRPRNVPADPGSADDVQHPAALEVDEQKPGARVSFQIAERVEEQVATEIRKAKFVARNHPHEAGQSTTVGDVETLRGFHLVELRRPGCNKERVGFGNKADLVIA